MKKSKKFVFWGSILLIIGIVLWVVGMGKLDWDFYKLDSRVFEEKYYEQLENSTSTHSIKMDIADVKLTVVKGDRISYKYFDTERQPTTITENGSTLKIEKNDYFTFALFQFNNPECILTVPDDMNLDIDCANVTIILADVKIGTLNIQSGNANVQLKNTVSDVIEISSGNADLLLQDITADSLDVDAANIDAKLTNCKLQKARFDAANIKVMFDEGEAKDVTFEGANIRLDGTLSADRLKFDGANVDGKVTLYGTLSEYTVNIDAVFKHINNQQGTNANKIISGDSANFGLRFSFKDKIEN